MKLWRRLLGWRASRKAGREAIAREQREALRAGDQPPQSMTDIVATVAARFPRQQ